MSIYWNFSGKKEWQYRRERKQDGEFEKGKDVYWMNDWINDEWMNKQSKNIKKNIVLYKPSCYMTSIRKKRKVSVLYKQHKK